ncbi:MAG: hypothetical protein WCI92_20460, partial [Bacteroidota bacterium]
RLRCLWEPVRHRIPLQVHEKIKQLVKHGKLQLHSGKLLRIKEDKSLINVLFFDKVQRRETGIMVSTVINCTGPETDLLKLEKSFLKNCLVNGSMVQDELRLGILADPHTFEIYNSLLDASSKGKFHHRYIKYNFSYRRVS